MGVAYEERLRRFILKHLLYQSEIWWTCISCREGDNEDTSTSGVGENAEKFRHAPNCEGMALATGVYGYGG